MKLPIKLDMEPMLSAPSANGIPEGDGWEYEPKWDGFRTLVFRDGDQVELVSRGARPMTRYFPEVLPAFRTLREKRLVLDGELVVVAKHGLDFGALQQRIHPAESRVRMLSEATPAWYIAFDVLAAGDADLRSRPLGERRKRLEALLKGAASPIFMTPYTRDPKTASRWFEQFEGAGLDGVIAKSWNGTYVPGKRLWVKVKHQRTADCVVIGWRRSNDGKTLGALLLGLYDKKGTLHYVGHTSSFNAAEKRELIARLKPLETAIPAEEWNANPGRMPGGLSRTASFAAPLVAKRAMIRVRTRPPLWATINPGIRRMAATAMRSPPAIITSSRSFTAPLARPTTSSASTTRSSDPLSSWP